MKKNIRKLSESFLHAFRGLRLCIHDERNFRVHMTAAFYVILFAVFAFCRFIVASFRVIVPILPILKVLLAVI